tara:strand:- start:83 stop:541 length:459 start_codon:yes stop_codon:yes gene_type:complete
MAVTANINGSAFNEGGGVTFTNNTGAVAGGSGVFANAGINQSTVALPGDGADFHTDGITATLSVAAASGTLVSAVANRSIDVISYTFVADAATTVRFYSNTNAISGGMTIAANGGITQYGENGSVLFTNPGEALIVSNSAGNINGHITYRIA